MQRTVFIVLVILVTAVAVFPQSQQQRDVEKEKQQAKDTAFDQRVDQLRNTGKERFIRDRYKDTRIYQDNIVPLYRDLKEDELALLAPDASDTQKYGAYVQAKERGLIRLIADQGCDLRAEVVVAKEHCEKYAMPGAGSSYSFRSEMYRVKRLADISFIGDSFDTRGNWKHGILISLGNFPMEELTAESQELATLVGFTAQMDVTQAGVFAGHLEKGIPGGQILYKDSHPVKLNNTYVVRSIAYRGEYWESVNEVTYDELEFDKRRDVVVAFRVVRIEPGKA